MFSSSYAASNGFYAILLIFSIIVSIGPMTRSFESLMKIRAEMERTRQTKIVHAIPRPPSNMVFCLKSNYALYTGASSLSSDTSAEYNSEFLRLEILTSEFQLNLFAVREMMGVQSSE
jgi:hypothetical protein